MAFTTDVFPVPPTIHDIRRTVIDPVQVITNGSYEQRIKRQRFERFTWEIPTQTMTNAQKENMRAFISEHNNGLDSFLYNDPELSNMTEVPLLLVPGTTTDYYAKFGMTKTGGTAVVGNHPIFYPGTEGVDFNLIDNSGTIPVNEYSFVVENGIPMFRFSTLPTGPVKITGSVPFVVRVDSSFSETAMALDCNNDSTHHSVNSIKLISVFGEY